MSNEQDPKNTENEPKPSDELANEELDQVVGGTDPSSGKVQISDLNVTKHTDSSSSLLFLGQ